MAGGEARWALGGDGRDLRGERSARQPQDPWKPIGEGGCSREGRARPAVPRSRKFRMPGGRRARGGSWRGRWSVRAWRKMGRGVVEAVAEARWLVRVARWCGGASGLRGMRECAGGVGERKWRLWLGVGFGKGVVMAVPAARRAAPAEWAAAGAACLRASWREQVKSVSGGCTLEIFARLASPCTRCISRKSRYVETPTSAILKKKSKKCQAISKQILP